MRKGLLVIVLFLLSFCLFGQHQHVPDTLGNALYGYNISKYKVDEKIGSTWTDTFWSDGSGKVLIYKSFIELNNFTEDLPRDVYLIYWRSKNKGYLIQLKTFAVVAFKFYATKEHKILELSDEEHKVTILFYDLSLI